MGRPIDDYDRERVLRLHSEGEGRNQIAHSIGRSAASVSKIARERGLTLNGGAHAAAATEARRADAATRRELLADAALDDALGQVDYRRRVRTPCPRPRHHRPRTDRGARPRCRTRLPDRHREQRRLDARPPRRRPARTEWG